MPTILSNSNAIHAKIREMFAIKTRGRRRVILVAYVGKDAPSLLPDARDVEIYCWPQAGATHPDAIRTLIQSGAKVRFVPNLHMKLYWVEGIGALFTSANLSRNALGEGGLHEAGVFLSDSETNELDIDSIIGSLDVLPVTQEALDQLQRESDTFNERLQRPSTTSKLPTLAEWFEQSMRRPWKLGWFEEINGSLSKDLLAQAMAEYQVQSLIWSQSCKGTDYQKGDWALDFLLTNDGKPPSKFEWRFIHLVVPVDKDDPAYIAQYPFQAAQAVRANKGTTPPFKLDTVTKAALSATIERYGQTNIKRLKVPKPSSKFLDILKEEIISRS